MPEVEVAIGEVRDAVVCGGCWLFRAVMEGVLLCDWMGGVVKRCRRLGVGRG